MQSFRVMHVHPGPGRKPPVSDKPDEPHGCDGDEFVIPGPPLPNGGRACIHHAEDHTVRPGVLMPMEEGKAIPDNAMLLEAREGTNLYNVVGSIASMKEERQERKGPSKVNSRAFKNGWDNIFGVTKAGDA